MIRVIKRNLLLILSLCFVLSLGCFAFVKTAQHQAKADDYVSDAFEMVEGAQLKLDGDGLRFVVRLGSDTYDSLAENENLSLSFLIAPKSFFDAVDAGATPGEYENLSKKKQIDIPFNRIYVLDDGYYYANAVLTNIATAASSPQYEYNFVATAMIKDTAGVEDTVYADFSGKNIENNARTQYDVAQATVLSEEMDQTDVEDLVTDGPYTAWFGTSSHPVLVETLAKYERYEAISSYNLGTFLFQSRTPDEFDTVAFMCDKEVGVKQFYPQAGTAITNRISISYSTKKTYGEEDGSVKITFDAVGSSYNPYIYYNLLDSYDANRKAQAYNSKYSGKFVRFNVYNDTAADFIDVSMGGYFWFRVPRGEWRPVVWPAESLWRSSNLLILGSDYSDTLNEETGEPTGTSRVPLNGDVYISKGTVVNYDDTDNVKILGGSGAAIEECTVTVGHTDVSATYWNTIGNASSYTPSGLSPAAVSGFYGKTAYVDGSIMAYGVSWGTRDYGVWIGLAEPEASAVDKVMYITLRGVHSDSLKMLPYVGGKAYDTYGSVVETYDDGFVKYAFYFGRNNTSLTGSLTGFYLWVLSEYSLTHIEEIEIRDIEIKSLATEAAAVRAVEGADTVFMFDNPIGVGQVRSNQVNSIRFNPDVHIEGENGSLELDYAGNAVGYLGYSFLNSAGGMDSMDSDKYVVFYVYNDTTADIVDVEVTSGYKYRFRIYKGEWGMVIWSATTVDNSHFWMRFEAADFSETDYAAPSSKNVSGKLYLSKGRLLDSDEVHSIPSARDNATYDTIGSVEIDSISWRLGQGTYNPNSAAFNSETYGNIYYVDGTVRALALAQSGETSTADVAFGIYFRPNTHYFAGNKLYVTIKGADDGFIKGRFFNFSDTKIGDVQGVKEQTLPDGFVTYSFDIGSLTSFGGTLSMRLYVINNANDPNGNGGVSSTPINLKKPHMREIIIKDMWFDLQRTALERTVDFFVDVPEGRDIKVLQITDTQIIDSSTAREGDAVLDGGTQQSSYRNTANHDSIDIYCFKYLRELIEETQPDFIIMTGDNVYGKYDDDGHILTRLIECMESFGIPWAPIIGNHDAGTALGIDWVCEQYEKAENCLFKQRSLSGNGNYTVGIRQGGELKRLFVMLDSNGYSDNAKDYTDNGHTYYTKGFANDQIAWYTNTVNAVKELVPSVKISFAWHIQMKEFYKDLNRAYGDEIAPTGTNTSDYKLSIDALGEDKHEGDFGFDGEYYTEGDKYGWYTGAGVADAAAAIAEEADAFADLDEASVFAGMKELGVDSIFIGHAHRSASSVVYDGVRVQFGLKSSRHDYLQLVYKANGQFVSSSFRYWLDSANGDNAQYLTMSPIIGGAVLSLSSADGSIGDDGYQYFCTGAGKGLDPSTWNPSGS